MRLLLVEDDPDLSALLARGLVEEGYAVDLAANVEDGTWRATTVEYDVVVLDRMLPGGDGVEILERMRRAGRLAPVLFLTARDTVPERVDALDSGGDDYLVKPFKWEELLARLRALLRRGASRSPTYTVGSLEVDPTRKTVRLGGTPLDVTAKEFGLLHVLARAPDRVHSRSDLIEHVWDDDAELNSNVVEVYLSRLRRKLRGVPGAPTIKSNRGLGYSLRLETVDA